MVKEMENQKYIMIMVNYYLMENIKMENGMEQEGNIMKMVN